jgi:aconitate hydratase
VTATDIALAVTRLLRQEGVVGKFVEFFGSGYEKMTLQDRATIANMAPEYGATMGYFPVDQESLNYLRQTGRDLMLVKKVEAYYTAQGLLYRSEEPQPCYSHVIDLDLGSIKSGVAGPRRPQDLINLDALKKRFSEDLIRSAAEGGFRLDKNAEKARAATLEIGDETVTIKDGSVVLAAITSCTNTSNPMVMLGAGLMARKAVALGLRTPAYVKTSLTPGSQVVTEYLAKAGLLSDLEKLGFHVVGYGCCTCIGNSGPLADPIARAIDEHNLVVASVLSGNRNFEGRIHPQIRASYLASPMLVVAYALAGTVAMDWKTEPIGQGTYGETVFLSDIWPTAAELSAVVQAFLGPELFRKIYSDVFSGPPSWQALEIPDGERYRWDEASTYIQEPPFFSPDFERASSADPAYVFYQARILALLGDTVTTDHISPAGSIAATSPAGLYLQSRGVSPADFNAYGARRGNHHVMLRGTFANSRLRNHLVPGIEGGFTKKMPEDVVMTIYDAAMAYAAEKTGLIIIAGKEYGTGSSRDWAAKGTHLLGVTAVLAEGFERIHRSNLVGMGVAPLVFTEGQNAESLGLDGTETFNITGLSENLKPHKILDVKAVHPSGNEIDFKAVVRFDSAIEIEYYKNQGILQYVLRQYLKM